MKRLLLVLLFSGCGGMNLEFGGIRMQTGATPDPMARGVFGPNQEPYPVQIVSPQYVTPVPQYETRTEVECNPVTRTTVRPRLPHIPRLFNSTK